MTSSATQVAALAALYSPKPISTHALVVGVGAVVCADSQAQKSPLAGGLNEVNSMGNVLQGIMRRQPQTPAAERAAQVVEKVTAAIEPDALTDTIMGMMHRAIDGEIAIAPGIASRLLTEANWEGQRSVASWHVDLLAEIMRRGEWKDGSQIALCLLDGKLHLVNGQHRMEAVVKAAKAQRFQVKIHRCDSLAEVAQHYWSYDVAARQRSNAEILRAPGFATQHGLSRTMADKLYGCTPLLGCEFERQNYHIASANTRDAGKRMSIATAWVREAAVYQSIIDEAYSQKHKTRLLSSSVMSIALYTIRHQPGKAMPFWAGVANGEGLKRGDPRKTLIADFDNRHITGGNPDLRLLPVSLAWNAWYQGRELSILKVPQNATFSLAGTPLAKGRKS